MGNKSRYTANLVSDNNLFVDITNDHVGIGTTHPTAKLDVDGTLNVSGVSTFQGNVNLGDNDKIKLGDNDDFQIFHHSNGTGIIQNAGSGQLQLRSDTIRLLNQATDEDFAFFRDDGAVELYYDHSKKFETTGYGVTVYGGVNATGVSTFANVNVTGLTTTQNLNVSGISTFNGKTRLLDDVEFHIGTNGVSGDYKFYRDSSNIRNILYEDISGAEARFISNIGGNSNAAFHFFKGSDALARFSVNNVQLHSGGSKKFETTASGIDVIGHTETDTLNVSGIVTAASFSGNGNDIVHSTWTLGANGSSHYTFTGPGGLSNTDDPKIYLARGQTYEFVNNSGGSHPFQIQQSNGSAYSTGVTNNGASSGTIRFEVPFSAPNTLQYKCTSHSSMGNTIIVYPDISP